MKRILFDSSVIIAILRSEEGYQNGEKYLNQGAISTMNWAEVAGFLGRNNAPKHIIQQTLAQYPLKVLPYDENLVVPTGHLAAGRQHLGLSLGDRACLATAMAHQLPVLTADRIWKELEQELSLDIQLIR